MRSPFIAGTAAVVLIATACAALPACSQLQMPTGPEVFRRFGRLTSMNEPTLSAMLSLLTRPDVQQTLQLTLKQKRDLEALQTKSFTDIVSKVGLGINEFQNLTPEERAEQRGELPERARTAIGRFVGDLDRDTEAILTPGQIKRMHELDLQWRGPMAAGDPRVAEALQLSQEQKQRVAEIVADYHVEMQKAFMSGFAAMRRGSGAGENGAAPPAPPSADDIRNAFIDVDKSVAKTRAEHAGRVLALFSEEQRAHWSAMLGKGFHFSKLADEDQG
jgi:hypothetical protein